MKGRKPRSTVQRRLEGNPGKRPFNHAEPKPPALAPGTFDAAPSELAGDATATAEWMRLAPMLSHARQITEADRSALIAACMEWSRYVEAMREVRKFGLLVNAPGGQVMINPCLSIATKALAGCNKLWPELGLTPSSRSRVVVADDPADDAFAKFDRPRLVKS